MPNLKAKYEHLTGKSHKMNGLRIDYVPTWEYVNWLEVRVEQLTQLARVPKGYKRVTIRETDQVIRP